MKTTSWKQFKIINLIIVMLLAVGCSEDPDQKNLVFNACDYSGYTIYKIREVEGSNNNVAFKATMEMDGKFKIVELDKEVAQFYINNAKLPFLIACQDNKQVNLPQSVELKSDVDSLAIDSIN